MGGLYGNAAATALEDCPSEARGIISGILQQGVSFLLLSKCFHMKKTILLTYFLLNSMPLDISLLPLSLAVSSTQPRTDGALCTGSAPVLPSSSLHSV
jgi:hypothetical protein